jgi:hypothetical protein
MVSLNDVSAEFARGLVLSIMRRVPGRYLGRRSLPGVFNAAGLIVPDSSMTPG